MGSDALQKSNQAGSAGLIHLAQFDNQCEHTVQTQVTEGQVPVGEISLASIGGNSAVLHGSFKSAAVANFGPADPNGQFQESQGKFAAKKCDALSSLLNTANTALLVGAVIGNPPANLVFNRVLVCNTSDQAK
jgi:hypothetical protein